MEMAGAMLADGGIVRLVMACQGRNKKQEGYTRGAGVLEMGRKRNQRGRHLREGAFERVFLKH